MQCYISQRLQVLTIASRSCVAIITHTIVILTPAVEAVWWSATSTATRSTRISWKRFYYSLIIRIYMYIYIWFYSTILFKRFKMLIRSVEFVYFIILKWYLYNIRMTNTGPTRNMANVHHFQHSISIGLFVFFYVSIALVKSVEQKYA